MVQSPSWAADWFAASQEIPRISRNPKVHYRTHKRTPCYYPYLKDGMSKHLKQLNGATKATYSTVLFTTH